MEDDTEVDHWVEPTMTKVLADALRIENLFTLLPKWAGRFSVNKHWEERRKPFVTL